MQLISNIFHILGSWSASTSPARSPPSPHSRYSSGVHGSSHHRKNPRNHLNYKAYGTTSLMQRSRSPSPARVQEMRDARERYYRNEVRLRNEMGTHLFFLLSLSTFQLNLNSPLVFCHLICRLTFYLLTYLLT